MTRSEARGAETFTGRREHMVERQIAARGIRDRPVLEAMRAVPRELFVPDSAVEFAYHDTPLPIEEGQTISQPYIVALMAAALTKSKTVTTEHIQSAIESGSMDAGSLLTASLARDQLSPPSSLRKTPWSVAA